MEFEVISESLKGILGEEIAEYHHKVLAENKIWFFSMKYQEQPTFNWGHRISYAGGYAIAFNIETKQWEEKIDYPPLHEEENGSEYIFAINGQVYLLYTASHKAIEFKNLYHWTGSAWEQLDFQAPEKVDIPDDPNPIKAVVATSTSLTDRMIIFTNGMSLSVYRISIYGNPDIQHVTEFNGEATGTMFSMAVSAVQFSKKLLVCFAIRGCVMMWQKDNFLLYDEESNQWKNIGIPGEWSDGPQYGFTGASSHGIAPNGDWIHVGGSQQVGMCDSKFHGAVWAMTNLGENPEWKKLAVELHESNGYGLIDWCSGKIYGVGDTIAVAQLE